MSLSRISGSVSNSLEGALCAEQHAGPHLTLKPPVQASFQMHMTDNDNPHDNPFYGQLLCDVASITTGRAWHCLC